jgi:hypothetical protein
MTTKNVFAVPSFDFELVSRSDVAASRPIMEAAGYRCENCGHDDSLRVVRGYGQLVVLCQRCRSNHKFRAVLGARRARRLTGSG